MKLLLLSALIFSAVFAAPYDDSILGEWNQYKANFNKVYETPEEDNRRLKIYMENKLEVEEHNRKYDRGETSYTLGINKFSDWFPEEIDRVNGLKMEKSTTGGRVFKLQPGTTVPRSVNWVKRGAVTNVKDQGLCGSCYAFSAAGALEGLMFRTNKTITDLSVQELVDCSENSGCSGGYMENCFNYVMDRPGIDSNISYPYKACQSLHCQAEKGKIATSCTNYEEIKMGDEKDLKAAVGTVGPVSIGFRVSKKFLLYKGGVYDGRCSYRMNHGMLLVGYGKDNETGQDYWLVKNSWGVKWGEKGYARVIRHKNKCGIANGASYPVYE